MTSTRTFCPLILYHDNLSKELSMRLSENQQEYRVAIDYHRNKTNEMLEFNARSWTEQANNEFSDINVSPSTSTASNISSSSSSSGESIATLEQQVKLPEYDESKKTFKSKTATDTTKKRRRGNLPKEVTEFLRKWLIQHKKHPYPAEKEKIDLARHTGLTVNQISNWFINARRRILQPMLESENLSSQYMVYPPDYDKKRQRQNFYAYSSDTLPESMSYQPYSDKVFYQTRSTEQYQH